jgi:MoxR-like ATPase
VYLWEAGANGGIVAAAEVLDRPSVRPISEASRQFVKDARFTEDQLRVGLAIRHVVDIPKSRLREEPKLQNLSIFGFSQATNFPVTPEEAAIIEDLIMRQVTPDSPQETPPTDPLADLAERLLLDRQALARIMDLLAIKKQVIFYGPPGTGKTFVAKAVAAFLAGSSGSVETVQFHASYAYEDFMEGYRPTLVAGQPGFHVVSGPLKRVAERARQSPEATHVLVIDELNRSNVAKVFGELYYLLEYREAKIALQYSPNEPFRLPENLWIIGTMNTADRSIALVDAALRRRFYFVPFFPDQPPIQGLLQRWLARHKPDLVWVAAVVDEANRRLGDRHTFIGPSYFMASNLTEDWVGIIWRHAIAPYLEEQFFGEPDRLKEFDLGKLREAIGPPPATA